jgi:hypothetical protein
LITPFQVTKDNQQGFEDLQHRCERLKDTIVTLLKGKEFSEIPLKLQLSLAALERYDHVAL